jgi:hypothetical protein
VTSIEAIMSARWDTRLELTGDDHAKNHGLLLEAQVPPDGPAYAGTRTVTLEFQAVQEVSMRASTILVAALMTGISVACSKPAPSNSQVPRAGSPADDREIRLVNAPSSDAPVVSALEAGRESTHTQSISTRLTRSMPVATAASPASDLEPSTEAALPSLALTEVAAPATLVPSTTTLPVRTAGTDVPAAGTDDQGGTSGRGARTPYGGTRGPVILIRGGMGTPHDDCKLHPVASRGAGIAINNVAPPIPGRVAVSSRLTGGNGGFTRIR